MRCHHFLVEFCDAYPDMLLLLHHSHPFQYVTLEDTGFLFLSYRRARLSLLISDLPANGIIKFFQLMASSSSSS